MGRGRQKAKQTKVARQLKYFSPTTDYNALQQELGKSPSDGYAAYVSDEVEDDEDQDDEDEDEADGYQGWAAGTGR